MKRFFFVILLLMPVGLAFPADLPSNEDCAMCHDEVAEAFIDTVHAGAMTVGGGEVSAIACATCHEADAAHMDEPSPENVSRKPADAACLSCHAGHRAATDETTAAHLRHKVGCTDCHEAGHGTRGSMIPSTDRCASCHQGVAASFRLPMAHRSGGEPFDCEACHSIHGLDRGARSILAPNGGACIDCHSEKRLPSVFPHPPADRRGCVSCHLPHGSTNPRQLTRPSVAMLCLECHSGVPSFHDISQARYRSCQSCHSAVHGSNHDPLLFEE